MDLVHKTQKYEYKLAKLPSAGWALHMGLT